MTEQLTRDDIDRLREWQDTDVTDLSYGLQRRAIADLLRLQDERERLRRLQPKDVTQTQIHAVESIVGQSSHAWDFVPESDLIAAAVRVIVASLDKSADTA